MAKKISGLMLTGLVLNLVFLGISRAQISKPEGSFTLTMQDDLPILDPQNQAAHAVRSILGYIYEPLVTSNLNDMSTQHVLAESWELIDPRTWKINLRKGVKFHNGQFLTSADVKFSIERVMGVIDTKFPGYHKPIIKQLVDTVETPNDHTIIVHTKRPDASFLYFIQSIFIISKAYFETFGDVELAKRPLGTGPFKFKERKIAEFLSLEANENYWNNNPASGAQGPSRIKTATFRIIPQESTRISAFKAGEVDAINANGLGDDNAKLLEKDARFQVYYGQSNQVFFLIMNWKEEKNKATGQPNPFYDVRVRRAINYAIDVDAIIKNYLTGREHRTTMVGTGAIGWNPNVPWYEFNPNKAKELLAEAGYSKGFKTTFSLAGVNPWQVTVKQYLKDVGIDAEFNIKSSAVLTSYIGGKKLDGFMALSATEGSDTVGRMAIGYFTSDGPVALHAKDDRVDELAVKQSQEFNVERRAKIIHEMIAIIWKDAWYVPLWEPVNIYAINNDWKYEYPKFFPGVQLTHLSKKRKTDK